ncbi:hypothetical protein ACFFX0_21880 [Citricoccus parietis]|uniref:Uncharacterized protein n=1 Tax=Citricoccus parietis TaxID=592307 RepID=A0ABV5G442_9MICC
MVVRMAQAGGMELDPDLVLLRRVQLQVGDLPAVVGPPGDGRPRGEGGTAGQGAGGLLAGRSGRGDSHDVVLPFVQWAAGVAPRIETVLICVQLRTASAPMVRPKPLLL